MKVDKGKVLLTFCPILTKRLNYFGVWTLSILSKVWLKKSYSHLSQLVKFCIACHLSSHPLKCKCIFSVFLGHWYKFDLSFLWGWFLRTPSWLCLSPPDKPMSMVIKFQMIPIGVYSLSVYLTYVSTVLMWLKLSLEWVVAGLSNFIFWANIKKQRQEVRNLEGLQL